MVLVCVVEPAPRFLGKAVYTVSVQRDFVAQHFLIGADWGDESNVHSHDYRLELRLLGKELDEHGFLVDIVGVEKQLDLEVERYVGATLNDLDDFEGINPSLEHFSQILCSRFGEHFRDLGLSSVEVRLWESETAWASYRLEF